MSMTHITKRFERSFFGTRLRLAVLGLILATGIGWWGLHAIGASDLKAADNVPQRRTFTVTSAPIVSNLNEVGVIQPGSRTVVTAPFDGFIKERRGDIGSHVDQGDIVLVMDTSEIDTRVRDAESALLKAAIAVDSLKKWSTGSDVLRAKRVLANALAQFVLLDQQAKQAKTLIDRGIISKNEYDGLLQQVSTQRDQVASAQQDLDSTIDRGNANNRRLAELELATAKARVGELMRQRTHDVVYAGRAGILMRPPATSSERTDSPQVDPGGHVTRGQALVTIANLDNLIAELSVDEIDVNQIHVGQEVAIESDSFPGDPIRGEIVAVGGEADQTPSGGSARFPVKAQFVVDAKRRASIRIGMSARLTITTYKNLNAIVIPEDAVATSEGHHMVQILDSHTGLTKAIEVTLGTPTPSGIEVLMGLRAGSIIAIP